MEIYHRVNGQLPEYIRQTYPVFARFIEEYYRWLESRQLGKLENITDIDFLSRGVTIVENTSDLADWVGFVIVDEVTGAKAIVCQVSHEGCTVSGGRQGTPASRFQRRGDQGYGDR